MGKAKMALRTAKKGVIHPVQSNHITSMKTHHIDWSKIDWSKSNREIAKDLGVGSSTVSYRRRGYHERHGRRTQYRIDWTGADWTKPNHVLAQYYCCTPQAVAIARAHSAPPTLKISPSARTSRKRLQAVIDERIARAEQATKEAPAVKPERPAFRVWNVFFRLIGFNLR